MRRLQLLHRPGIKPGPHGPEAKLLTTTLLWRLASAKCGVQAPPQGSPQASRLRAWCSERVARE